MAVLLRTVKQGATSSITVDCGDSSAIDTVTGAKNRILLQAGESVSSATISVERKPSGASDPTFGTPAVIASNTECNDRIVAAG